MKSPWKKSFSECSRFISENYNQGGGLHGNPFENVQNNNVRNVHINGLNLKSYQRKL